MPLFISSTSTATHYSDGTIQTDPGIGNPPTASLS
jgi:hypothetical protein